MTKWRVDINPDLPGSYYRVLDLTSEGIAKALASLSARIDVLEEQLAARPKKRKP